MRLDGRKFTIGRMQVAADYPRFAEPRLLEALADTPVVLIHGPRQCGKTTLANRVGADAGYAFVSFDDELALASAQEDPVGFIGDLPEHAILDEIQRAPGLFLAIKSSVDRHRTPGRVILTGSANGLLLPRLADSLAGRMEILRLHPLSQGELAGKPSSFLTRLFSGDFPVRSHKRMGIELVERVLAGGYPAALARDSASRRAAWYRDFVETQIQRDVRDYARIRAFDILPRLLSLAAGQTSRLINFAELAGPFQVSRPTIQEYVTLLERIFLLESVPPWHSNQLSRLIKTPKLHLGDTGMAASLLGYEAETLAKDRPAFGQLLETFVFQELRRQASWHDAPFFFYHLRDKSGSEVDIVLERSPREIAGIEVKASATVTSSDFNGLRKLKGAAGDRFRAGVVLYDGEYSLGFGEGLYAVPVRRLWEDA